MGLAFMRKWFSHPASELDPELLDAVYARRFSSSDKARLGALWAEIAHVLDVEPADLHETDRIDERCPPPRHGICFNGRLEDLSVLIQRESHGRPPPTSPLVTVGDILEYLLEQR
jgi:hypothetical protein